MTKAKSIFLKRTIYALLIVAIVVPAFALTFYGQMPGRIIGMIIFTLAASLGLYEVCSFMTKNHFIIFLFTLILVIATFLLPYNSFLQILTTPISELASLIKDPITLKGVIYFNFSWETFLVPIFSVILFMLIDKNLRDNFELFCRNFVILIIASFLTSFLAKGLWIINIFDWSKAIFVISIAVISDTFAYVGGALFGRKLFGGAKLAPRISPKKTWAGSFIAFVITVPFAGVIGYYINFWNGTNHEIILLIVGSFLLAIATQFGDLLFSWFKRMLHIKDFSSLIPIHGGIFDRVDGISMVIFITIILFIIG